MRNFLKSKKGVVTLLATVVVAVAAVGAYAYFTNTGTSTGSPATVGAVTPDTFTAAFALDPLANSALMPTARDSANKVIDTVNVTVTNNDEAAEHVHQIIYSVDPAWTDNTAFPLKPACSASDFSVGGEAVGDSHTVSTYDDDLAPNSDGAPADQATHSVTLQMIDNSADQDNCQGVSPRLKAEIS